MSGFPNRPDLAAFGPDSVNTRAVRDPTRELSATTFNLMKFQLAGLGIVGMRAMLRFTTAQPPVILARAEAWNPRGLTAAPFASPVVTRLGLGLYNVVYTSPVTDEAGNSVALSFTHGIGCTLAASSTVLKHVMVTPLSGSANGVKVAAFSAAGTAEDIGSVAIFLG